MKEIWFPAKKYGYGWGFPIAWQGWAVMLAYILLATIGSVLITKSPEDIIWLIIYNTVLAGLMIFICYKKGEKSKWRWGDKK